MNNSETPPWGAPFEKAAKEAIRVGSSSPRIGPHGPPPLKPQVPDHELIRCIGRGGYGEVWLARNIMGTFRAVKVVYRSSFEDERPFEREFEGIRRFEPISRTHESQLNVLHVGRGEGYFYYVMELADDQGHGQEIDPGSYAPRTLRSEITQQGRLPFEQCLRIALALTTALDHLHEHDLVHRDIKPSNVIFVNGIPKLADIGLVARADATLSFVGTEGYVPPEGPGSPQADLYSLGKLLYEISTGRDRQDYPELPTDLRDLTDREGVVELNEVIIKACQAEASRRYRNAREMHDELVLLQSGKSLARIRTVERTMARLKRFTVAGIALTAVITAGFFWQSNQARRMREMAREARENVYAADIGAAQRALEQDNLRQALDLLQRHIPKPGESDLRGFEWRYLWRQCQSDERFSLPGHQQPGNAVAFSPDGQFLASGGVDTTVKVWDLATHRAISTLTAHTNGVTWVCFSPNGNLLAAASDTACWVWDAKTFQPLRLLPQARFEAKFCPDGTYLATAGSNDTLIVYDTHAWNITNTVQVTGFRARGADFGNVGFDFSPDSKEIAIVGQEGVKLFTIPDLREVGTLNEGKGRIPESLPHLVCFGPSGRTLAASSSEAGRVNLWSIEDKNIFKTLTAHSDSLFALVFSPDGKRLASCSPDETVKLWDVASGQVLRKLKGHLNAISSVAFSPDGKLLASVDFDGKIKVWDGSMKPQQIPELPSSWSATNNEDFFLPCGFDHRGELMGFNGKSDLLGFDPETLQEVSRRHVQNPFHEDAFVLLGNLFNDGHTCGGVIDPSNSYGGAARFNVTDLAKGQFLCSVECASYYPAFEPGSQLLATVTSNQTVTIWQLPAGSRKFVLTNAAEPLAFSPDGSVLASADGTHTKLVLWKINKHVAKRLNTLDQNTTFIDAFCFSPDGSTVATALNESVVKLWNIPTGREIGKLIGHKRCNFSASFSPDGRTLATMSDDRTVRLWHVASQRELLKLVLPMDSTAGNAVEFSPDGRTLMTVRGFGHWNRLYFAPSLAEIAVAENTDYRSLADGPVTWLAVGKALERRGRLDEAVGALREVIQRSANKPGLEDLRKRALSSRAKLLVRQGGFAEAGADNLAAMDLLPRDTHASAKSIDLSPYYNGTLDSNSLYLSIPPQGFLGELPRGVQVLPETSGIRFDVRGVIQVNNELDFPGIPHAVTNIMVHQKCRRVHFLHATHRWEAGSGTKVGTYVFHFSDGGKEEFPILYGRDVHDWVPASDDPLDKQGGNVVWNDAKTGHRVYMSTWDNPRPETEITTFDFTSAMTKCGPFLIAVSVD